MENIEKEFAPYEQALALKELGFNESCLASWNFYTHELNFNGQPSTFSSEDVIQLPTFSQAFRWFREKYNLDSHIYKSGYYGYSFDIDGEKFNNNDGWSYEEAELACLKKLIEIVKNK